MTFGAFLTAWLVCGAVAAIIGQKKHFNVAHSFLLGAVLGNRRVHRCCATTQPPEGSAWDAGDTVPEMQCRAERSGRPAHIRVLAVQASEQRDKAR
jgi:hypothetical protein